MTKIYFPTGPSSYFRIIPSQSGVVVPLRDFGYPGLHVTLYVKETKDGKHHVNLHITTEKTGEMILEKYLEFDGAFMTRLLLRLQQRILPVTKQFLSLLEM